MTKPVRKKKTNNSSFFEPSAQKTLTKIPPFTGLRVSKSWTKILFLFFYGLFLVVFVNYLLFYLYYFFYFFLDIFLLNIKMGLCQKSVCFEKFLKKIFFFYLTLYGLIKIVKLIILKKLKYLYDKHKYKSF